MKKIKNSHLNFLIMPILAQDFLDGFTNYYHNFELVARDNFSTWTLRILNYFDQLGRLLGYTTKAEKRRYDLSWWIENDCYLHLEHENQKDYKRIISNTIEKIINTEGKIGISIVYPKDEDDTNDVIEHIKDNVQITNASQLLFILDGSYYYDTTSVDQSYGDFIGLIYNQGDDFLNRFNYEKRVTEGLKYYIENDIENFPFDERIELY